METSKTHQKRQDISKVWTCMSTYNSTYEVFKKDLNRE